MANILVLFEVKPAKAGMQHRMSQKEGRDKLFESYKITVCSEIRSYTDTERAQAPQDSDRYFELEG